MDIFSLAVGFIVGGLTGATSTYFGNKYTDIRRKKEKDKQKEKDFRDLQKRFPKIIDEMKEDLQNPKSSNKRIFFVKSSQTSMDYVDEPYLEYHIDKHEYLNTAISHLKDLGYIEDLTIDNVGKFRFYEHFIDKLKRL